MRSVLTSLDVDVVLHFVVLHDLDDKLSVEGRQLLDCVISGGFADFTRLECRCTVDVNIVELGVGGSYGQVGDIGHPGVETALNSEAVLVDLRLGGLGQLDQECRIFVGVSGGSTISRKGPETINVLTGETVECANLSGEQGVGTGGVNSTDRWVDHASEGGTGHRGTLAVASRQGADVDFIEA